MVEGPYGDHVEVAKWQTHQLEGLAPFRAWGFKSPLRHDFVFPLVTAFSGSKCRTGLSYLVRPSKTTMVAVLRATFDQLYDGHHTGRYRIDQLRKTEKTHCGTPVEINLHREFELADGVVLDCRIAGHEVDCKFSLSEFGWMIPPEAIGHLCLLVWADEQIAKWSAGLFRVSAELLTKPNRDRRDR